MAKVNINFFSKEIHMHGVQCKRQVIQFLEDGILLQKPVGCPDDVYHVMLGCWRRDPQERFAFDRVHRHLLELADGDGGAVTTATDHEAAAGATSATGSGRRPVSGQAEVQCDNDQQCRRQDDDSDEQQQQQQQQQQTNYSSIDFTPDAGVDE